MTPAELLRRAREEAALTQSELARRLGMSQPGIARLERPGANPSVATLDRALRATGHRLELAAPPWRSSVDETLLRQALRLRPAERLASFERLQREGHALAAAGARGRARPADG